MAGSPRNKLSHSGRPVLRVVSAMGLDEFEANALVRLSLGRDTSSADIDLLTPSLSRVLGRFC